MYNVQNGHFGVVPQYTYVMPGHLMPLYADHPVGFQVNGIPGVRLSEALADAGNIPGLCDAERPILQTCGGRVLYRIQVAPIFVTGLIRSNRCMQSG